MGVNATLSYTMDFLILYFHARIAFGQIALQLTSNIYKLWAVNEIWPTYMIISHMHACTSNFDIISVNKISNLAATAGRVSGLDLWPALALNLILITTVIVVHF